MVTVRHVSGRFETVQWSRSVCFAYRQISAPINLLLHQYTVYLSATQQLCLAELSTQYQCIIFYYFHSTFDHPLSLVDIFLFKQAYMLWQQRYSTLSWAKNGIAKLLCATKYPEYLAWIKFRLHELWDIASPDRNLSLADTWTRRPRYTIHICSDVELQ